MQKKQNGNGPSAEVYQGAVGCNSSIDFLPDAEHLNVVEKAFTDILGEAAW